MKRLLIILPMLTICMASTSTCAQSRFETNYKYTTEVFTKHLGPYLSGFAKAQYPPGQDSKERQLLEQSLVQVFRQNAEIINRSCYEEMTKLLNGGMKFDNKDIMLTLEKAYRYGFPGLDYSYFQKVEEEIKAKLGD